MGSDLFAFLVVGAVLGAIGIRLDRFIFGAGQRAGRKGWRGVFYVTSWSHPILAGGAIGFMFPSLPVPTWMGGGQAGSTFWYMLSGICSTTLYMGVDRILKHRLANAGGSSPQTASAPATGEPTLSIPPEVAAMPSSPVDGAVDAAVEAAIEAPADGGNV